MNVIPEAVVSQTYGPAGTCIYCGRIDRPLSKEHIVPYGLGGALVLPEASCKVCAAITSRIELHCLRGIYQAARVHIKLPSRKGHPKKLPVEVKRKGKMERIDLDIADHPGFLYSFEYDPPYILGGFEKLGLAAGGRISIRCINADNDAKLNRLGKINMPVYFNADTFAQMIAKIAYSYAVAERGDGAFRPLVRDVILSATPEDIHYVVGGRSKMSGDGLHLLSIEERELVTRTFVRRKLLVVNVQLFAQYDMPAFQVVVGEY